MAKHLIGGQVSSDRRTRKVSIQQKLSLGLEIGGQEDVILQDQIDLAWLARCSDALKHLQM